MRLPALWMMPFLLTAPVGCMLPTVALGASVSLGSGRGEGASGPARASVQSALWVALECSALASPPRDAAADVGHVQQGDPSPPCSLEPACDWERAAVRTAWLEQSSASEEGE